MFESTAKMVWPSLCKLLQKQTYDVLSHRYGTYLLTGGLILVIVSGFQFGEVVLEWSQEKYAAVFNSFSDNVAGRSYQSRLCLPVPIDVVYTWVNGSDPKLLADLRRFKASLELELNETRGPHCPFDNCVRSKIIIAESSQTTLEEEYYDVFKRATSFRELQAPGEGDKNVTALYFTSLQEADEVLKEAESMESRNISLHAAYYTSDWTLANAVLIADILLMTGFPHTLSAEQLLHKLPDAFMKSVLKIDILDDEGVAVMQVSSKVAADDLIHHSNFSIDGKEPTVSSASIIWDMEDVRYTEEISASRFADNEELRYSLRSIETFAPWVRHVYLVTNGQIPAWINLDNPRLTIVTHEDIFVNRSHLPAFSSPAIEAHLHRIPGLSNKFIYLNDDVMFGKEVWPDDFYTHAHGQKVYLTWPVPNCQDGCPSSWIRDGYCDKACNNSECEWDGGDCAGGAPNSFGDSIGGGALGGWHSSSDTAYCSAGCANNWLADRYCDQACNTKECGFDAGDCGVAHFDKLHRIELKPGIHQYTAPKGETVMYMNISAVFPEGVSLEEGDYDEDPCVRTATLAQKYRTMSILLYAKKNATVINFLIKGKLNDTELSFTFNVSVDPNETEEVKEVVTEVGEVDDGVRTGNITDGNTKNIDGALSFTFEDVPSELQQARVVVQDHHRDIGTVPSLSDYDLDDETGGLWNRLLQELEEGDITDKGFNARKEILWHEYVSKLKSIGKLPVAIKKNDTLEPKSKPPGDGEHHKEDHKPRNEHEGQFPVASNSNDKTFDSYLQSKQQHVPKKGGYANPDTDSENLRLDFGGRNPQNAPRDVRNVQHMAQDDIIGVKLNQKEEKPERKEQRDHQGEKIINNVAQMLDGLKSVKEKIAKESKDEGYKIIDNGPHGVVNENNHLDPKNIAAPQLKQPNPQAEDKKGDKIPEPGESKDGAGMIAGTPQYGQSSSFKTRKLNQYDQHVVSLNNGREGFLPWEKQHVFASVQKRDLERLKREEYAGGRSPSRRLLDTFGDSLRHVNRLYNNAFGYSARKVPAHMPHFIDRTIMYDLQARFPEEWDVTSSHRIRSSTDMQFAFAYMYFMMSEPEPTTVGDIFDELDNDHSGVLSDRELRTMATRVFDLPLDLQSLTSLEQMLINCSMHLPAIVTFTWGRQTEVYYDKNMPQVTKALLNNCGPVIDLIQKSFKGRTKHKFETLDDEEVAFKMIHTNVSQVVGQLDDIRRNPKKFICLNDNIDHSKDEAKTVKAVLLDFYESILPTPSSFELPREYRNRFLHTDELREWRKYRDWLKLWTQIALGLLILFTIGSFFADKILALRRRFYRHRQPSQDSSDDSASGTSGSVSIDSQGSAPDEGQTAGRPPDIVDV